MDIAADQGQEGTKEDGSGADEVQGATEGVTMLRQVVGIELGEVVKVLVVRGTSCSAW